MSLTHYTLVLLPLVSIHGRQERILQGFHVNFSTSGHLFSAGFLTSLIEELVYWYLDPWDIYRLVDYQFDLPSIL